MFRKKEIKKSRSLQTTNVICPLCKSKKVDGRIYGEGGRFECRDCRTIFTIEATKKT